MRPTLAVFVAALLFGGLIGCNGASVGSGCTQASDCPQSGRGDGGVTVPAVCLTGVASPGGYCAVPCTLPGTQDDCPVNSLCTAFAGGSFCARICQNQSECRTGYTCNGVTGSNVKTCQ